MQVFIKLIIKDSIVGDLVMPTRERAGKVIPPIMQSGKVTASGLFIDARGGFMVLDVADSKELSMLLSPLVDVFTITTHPVMPLEELPAILQMLAEKGL